MPDLLEEFYLLALDVLMRYEAVRLRHLGEAINTIQRDIVETIGQAEFAVEGVAASARVRIEHNVFALEAAEFFDGAAQEVLVRLATQLDIFAHLGP